ncbi:hypothetical protein LEP1GSC072_1237 [Leptospira noguchii str. Bonito]|nr:hypothetical protein LEP1GSC072_1237 [Leptospira noguchii str. Bonito]
MSFSTPSACQIETKNCMFVFRNLNPFIDQCIFRVISYQKGILIKRNTSILLS